MILLLDIGNSRTKWALLDAQGLGGGGAGEHAETSDSKSAQA